MKSRLLSLLLLMLLFGFFGTRVYAQEEGFIESFDDPTLPGWERSPDVEVAEGVLLIPAGGYAVRGGAWDDFELTLRLRYTEGGEATVQFRDTDSGSYALRIGTDHVALDRRQEGQSVELVAAPNPSPAGEWLEIGIIVAGGAHEVSLDGKLVLSASDPNPLQAGGIGLRYDGEGVGEFDDLAVTVAVGPPETEGATQIATGLVWVRTGGPPGGIGYDIRYNFDDPNVWYVTDANTGVYISTDNGYTWAPSNTGIPTQAGATGDLIPVFSLTVDPHDPDIVWAGTQNTGHIYKSTDGGQSWAQKENGVVIQYDRLSFRGFTVDPRSSEIVYAMGETTRNFPNPDETGGVVYKTMDGGENWEAIWEGGMPSALARYLWIDPRDPDVLFVSTGIFDRGAISPSPQNNLDAGLGVLKSTDGGQTWRTLGQDNGLEMMHIGSLYMHPDNPDVLLAAAGHLLSGEDATRIEQQGYSPAGVYRTADGGETWERVLQTPLTRLTEAFSSVEFCLSDPDIAYAGSDMAIYRSEDAGSTWTLVSGGDQGWGPPGVLAGWPIDMQCDPQDPDRIFANNYGGGNFLSEDGGVTWQNASQGYSGAIVGFVVVNPDEPGVVYATGRSGIWASYDGGDTWAGLRPHVIEIHPLDQGALAIDPSDPEHIIAGGRPGYVMIQSYDGGQTWEYIWSPNELGLAVDSYMLASAIAFAPSDPRIVYSAGSHEGASRSHELYPKGIGVLVSEDGGQTWTRSGSSHFTELAAFDLSVDPNDPNTAYAATSEGIYKTTDAGGNWTLIDMGIDNAWVWTVAIDPFDSQSLIAGVELMGAYVSRDGGETWQPGNAGWELNGSPSRFAFDPIEADVIYMGDVRSGVFRSLDGGLTWTKINGALLVRSVVDIALSTDGEHLYAATAGGGVYRLDLSGQPPQSASAPATEAASSQPGASETPPGALVSPTEKEEGAKPASAPTNWLLIGGVAVLVLLVGIGIGVGLSRMRIKGQG